MSAPIQRLHYFDQQFLRAADFTTEQAYHRQMLREHNKALHTVGVASGLALAGAGTAVTVSPGHALDADGEEIVLLEPRTVDLADEPAGQAVYVTIAFRARETDPTDETGVSDNTRWTDDPLLEKSPAAPADPTRTLILGLARRTGTQVTSFDNTDRRRASVPEAADLRAAIAAGVATRVAKAGDTMTGPLSIQSALTVTGGGVVGGVSLGRDPGGGIDYPYEYETVGVGNPNYNLRLQSPNAVAVHAGGAQRTTVDAAGLRLHADPARQIQLTVGSGGNGTLKVRHVDGKSATGDGDDDLYLNWGTSRPVRIGHDLYVNGVLRVMGAGDAPVKLVVGSGANGRIQVRHIDGKVGGGDIADDLYLNWDNGKTVHTGANLYVHGGALDWGGDQSHNGYVRLGAMQICWGRVGVNNRPGEQQLETGFPAPFSNVPAVTVSLDDPGYGSTVPTASVGSYNVRPGAFTILFKGSGGTGNGPVTVSYLAFGRWR